MSVLVLEVARLVEPYELMHLCRVVMMRVMFVCVDVGDVCGVGVGGGCGCVCRDTGMVVVMCMLVGLFLALLILVVSLLFMLLLVLTGLLLVV